MKKLLALHIATVMCFPLSLVVVINKLAIKVAVSLLVKNCPYFFLCALGIRSMYSVVASVTKSIMLIVRKLHYIINATIQCNA